MDRSHWSATARSECRPTRTRGRGSAWRSGARRRRGEDALFGTAGLGSAAQARVERAEVHSKRLADNGRATRQRRAEGAQPLTRAPARLARRPL
eukprot:scaffold931_cov383-Prasinococcus_capsulatus_cf.AAC.1